SRRSRRIEEDLAGYRPAPTSAKVWNCHGEARGPGPLRGPTPSPAGSFQRWTPPRQDPRRRKEKARPGEGLRPWRIKSPDSPTDWPNLPPPWRPRTANRWPGGEVHRPRSRLGFEGAWASIPSGWKGSLTSPGENSLLESLPKREVISGVGGEGCLKRFNDTGCHSASNCSPYIPDGNRGPGASGFLKRSGWTRNTFRSRRRTSRRGARHKKSFGGHRRNSSSYPPKRSWWPPRFSFRSPRRRRPPGIRADRKGSHSSAPNGDGDH